MAKKEKLVPNVSVKQCITQIIFSIFACVIALIPLTFGSIKLTMTYEYLPIIGNNTISIYNTSIFNNCVKLLKIPAQISEYISFAFTHNVSIYFYILAFNIVASLLLAIIRISILRFIFKIVSICAGIVMILIAITNVLYIIGFAGIFILGELPPDKIMLALETSRVLLSLGLIIFSLIMAKKQFKYFAKLY